MLTYILSSTVSEFSHSTCQKSLYITTPLRLNPPTEGFPWEISVKISVDVNGWPRYRMVKNKTRKRQDQ